MSINVTINEVAIDGCGPQPECLICVLFLIVKGNIIGRNGQVGCGSIVQEHRRGACLIGRTDAKGFLFLFSLQQITMLWLILYLTDMDFRI